MKRLLYLEHDRPMPRRLAEILNGVSIVESGESFAIAEVDGGKFLAALVLDGGILFYGFERRPSAALLVNLREAEMGRVQ
jgi:hypothetical protein